MRGGTGAVGRPRSEQARTAVLHAVDDLLIEVGYAAMTMKGIAAHAGVGRQTVYRWWSTKAEILAEAVGYDAPQELGVSRTGSASPDLVAYVDTLARFLTTSETGTAYRALLGEAQHDPAVASLLAANDPVDRSAREALLLALPTIGADLATAAALLVGPVMYCALHGRAFASPERLVAAVLAACDTPDARPPSGTTVPTTRAPGRS
jgi:AcrR family transcriptional regulator